MIKKRKKQKPKKTQKFINNNFIVIVFGLLFNILMSSIVYEQPYTIKSFSI